MSVRTLGPILLAFIQIIHSILMPLPLFPATVTPRSFLITTNLSFYCIINFNIFFFLSCFSIMSPLLFPSMFCFPPFSFLPLFFLFCLQNIKTKNLLEYPSLLFYISTSSRQEVIRVHIYSSHGSNISSYIQEPWFCLRQTAVY